MLHVARGGWDPPVDAPVGVLAVGGAMVEVDIARCGRLLGRGRCPLAGRRARLRHALIALGHYCFLGYLLGLQKLLCIKTQGHYIHINS